MTAMHLLWGVGWVGVPPWHLRTHVIAALVTLAAWAIFHGWMTRRRLRWEKPQRAQRGGPKPRATVLPFRRDAPLARFVD